MVYKVVNAEQLDADLGTVADAIRERAGTTEPLSFPNGMAAAAAGIVNRPDYIMQRAKGEFVEYYSTAYCYTPVAGMFWGCKELKKITVTNVHMLQYLFAFECGALEEINAPNAYYIGQEAFNKCSKLPLADFPKASDIRAKAFINCKVLETLILRNTGQVASLKAVDAFQSTPIASGTGYIYVPKVMADGTDGVAAYKAATNWAAYADQIRAIEDYPEITGGATA